MATKAQSDASPRPVADDDLLDKEQMAAKLGVSVHWVAKMVSARLIPHTRIGKHVRFAPHHVAQIVAMGEQPVAAAPSQTQVHQRRAAAPRPRQASSTETA
jgi:excisionase family DNA binding protein